ncbi:MAG: F0F1 ATP synthase subunit A [Bacillota bacterium]
MLDPGPQVVFYFMGQENLPITDTIIVSWLLVIALVVVSKIVTSNLQLKPGRVQNVAELTVSAIEDQIDDMLPGEGRKLLPFIATIFIYIGTSNLIVLLPGVPSPSTDLNLTLGLALVVFVVSHYYGMKEHGVWGYIKSQAEPVFFLLPLNIVGELAKPISHSFRLFGNMVGASIIVGLIYMFAPWLIPVPLHLWFDLFVGIIQAFIFGMIAIVYISVAKS